MCVSVSVFVCVCVCERERERERECVHAYSTRLDQSKTGGSLNKDERDEKQSLHRHGIDGCPDVLYAPACTYWYVT